MAKTRIYDSYADFEARADRTENGVSAAFAGADPDWDYAADNATNEGCWDCLGCRECTSCAACAASTACHGCHTCTGCHGCRDCRACTGCRECRDCRTCEGCTDCRTCEGCTGCRGLPPVRELHPVPEVRPPGPPRGHDRQRTIGQTTKEKTCRQGNSR